MGLRHHYHAQDDDWLYRLSCSIPANCQHFSLLCANMRPQRRKVAYMTVIASLSFSAVSQIKEV